MRSPVQLIGLSAMRRTRTSVRGWWGRVAFVAVLMGGTPMRPATIAAQAPPPDASEEDRPPLRMAMSGAFQPFSTTDVDGRLVGFDADVAREIARRLGRRAELIQTDWAGIQAGLQRGKYELIVGSMAITEERLASMSFSLPIAAFATTKPTVALSSSSRQLVMLTQKEPVMVCTSRDCLRNSDLGVRSAERPREIDGSRSRSIG